VGKDTPACPSFPSLYALPSLLAGFSPSFTTAAISQRKRVRRPLAQKRKHKKYKHVNNKKVLKEILIA